MFIFELPTTFFRKAILRKTLYITVPIFAVFFIAAISFSAYANEGGTIKGVVKTPWIKRYQALIYIEKVEGKEFLPPGENPFISQKDYAFRPHILPVLKGTTVDFTNDDNVDHSIFTPPGSPKNFNLRKYGVGAKKTVTFDNLGEVPLLCSVHAEMSGYIIVLQNPYFTFTDKKGNFEIKDVPTGTYRLLVWHEKLKKISKDVIIEAGNIASVEFKNKEFQKR